MRKNGVKSLLMGGQACVLYGAAEFSRDVDLAISSDQTNLERLQAAIDELQGIVIAVPPFHRQFLEAGQAVHFRCQHPDAFNIRVDVMSRMRGLEEFSVLWDRRTTWEDIEVLSLPDLVLAKKTQRDKDWPMLSRLVEANYFANRSNPSPQQVAFWLLEMRNPSLLWEVSQRFPDERLRLRDRRPLLNLSNSDQIQSALAEEERMERQADQLYWQPLKAELARLRQERTRM